MTKRHIDVIRGRRVSLRLLAERDLPMTLAWRNQARIRRWFINSATIMPEHHRRWFAQYYESDNDFVFIVEESRKLRKPIGQVALYNIDWERKRAEFGRMMIGEPDATGKGLAREATALILDYAFDQFKLEEVEANILRANVRSLSICSSCGMSEVGERDGIKRLVRTTR